MLVKIKNPSSFIKKNKICGYLKIRENYDVLAIVFRKKKVYYLVQDNQIDGMLYLYDADNFDVIDESICDYWIFRNYKYKNILKNEKYKFSIIIDAYIGPKELIDDTNFFFDIVEEPSAAIQALYNCLKTYGVEWKTPPQT